ncbi:hypothetical protein ACH4OW_10900 [Streptomyces sp. NPDC017056]|uniref:hypothetical protein n=1 Tax=Streptomyces sp. NPDC017056 TaxID=3364973 RepID=UPI003791CB59
MGDASTSGTGPWFAGLEQGTIATVTGTGQVGYAWDDWSAAQSLIDGPQHLAVDKGGNLYFADRPRHRVYKVSPQGLITTVAGTGTAGSTPDGGPAAAAQLNFPTGVAADADGNLYIGEWMGARVRKVDAKKSALPPMR